MTNDYYIHPHGICESILIGVRTRIWAFTHILAGAKIGDDCNICNNVFIENDVIVGDRVTVKCHVSLWDGLRVEDDVFIGRNVSFTNDKYPRSKKYKDHLFTKVLQGATIGAGSVILPGITIGPYAFVAAGSVVTCDVPEFSLVKGNPARISSQVCICGSRLIPFINGLRCSTGSWRGQFLLLRWSVNNDRAML